MKLKTFFEEAIRIGIKNDPRGKKGVQRDLDLAQKAFDKLSEKEKEYFDMESLTNPYADSRINFGDPNFDFKSILVGVDIDLSELLMVEMLKARGRKIDLVMSHHPNGTARTNLDRVMMMQADILASLGAPINVTEALMETRLSEVRRRLMPGNNTRTVDAAKLMNQPLLCLHTPCDNSVMTFLQEKMDKAKPDTLDDVIDLLVEEPEYAMGKKQFAGPNILLGKGNRRAGKVVVEMTGGTEGSQEIYQTLAASGINTLVGMHLSDEHRKKADEAHINFIIAGHMASDNLGINLVLDGALEKDVEVIECSGFNRVDRRTKKDKKSK